MRWRLFDWNRRCKNWIRVSETTHFSFFVTILSLRSFIAAFSMGFQNGWSSMLSKGAIRTTHHSGAVTDLGLFFGQWLQLRLLKDRTKLNKKPEFWKVRVLLPVLLAFFLGGLCGVAAVVNGSALWMLLPSGLQFSVFVGLLIFILKKRQTTL